MAVLLFVEQGKLTLLIRHKDDLVIHHTLHTRNAVHQCYQIHWHAGVVHLDVGKRTDLCRQVGAIHIHKTIYLTASVTHTYHLVIHLESCHAHHLVTEVHGKEAVNIQTCFLFVQKLRLDTGILQLVLHLSDFYQEISPLFVVEGHQTALLVLLRNGQIGHTVRIFSSVEIAEVGFGKELMSLPTLILELLSSKDVLLVQGIAFTQSLCDGSKQIGELIIAVYIGRIFLHWVLHSQDGRILSSLCIEHTDTVRVFHGEVDVLKDFLPLATSTKGIDRYGHANADCHEK